MMLSIVVVLLVAPHADTGQVATLLSQDRATSDAVRKNGLARGLAPAFGPSTLLLFEGAEIATDSASAIRVLERQSELSALRIQWLPLAGFTSTDGTLGVTYGVTTIAHRAATDTAGLQFCKYISVWQWQAGAWRLAAHLQTGLLSSDNTAPGTAPRPRGDSARLTAGGAAAFALGDRAFAQMAADSGAPAAFAAFAAPMAVIFAGTGELVVGPEAIRARLASRGGGAHWVWAPLFAGASASGDLGYTVGEATITAANGAIYFSKYLTVWRRTADGAVRFIVDGGNERPPAAH